jgi:hypothetical protein
LGQFLKDIQFVENTKEEEIIEEEAPKEEEEIVEIFPPQYQ